MEAVKCDLCDYRIQNSEADICPNCGADFDEQGQPDIKLKVLKARKTGKSVYSTLVVNGPPDLWPNDPGCPSVIFRLAACDGPEGERLAALPEPWPELAKLAGWLEDDRTQPYGDQPDSRCDLQNTLDMLTAAALKMAGQDDPRCSVVKDFLRALGHHLAGYGGDLRELEHYVRKTAPTFPSWRSGETLAESIGQIWDGLQAVRNGVQGPGDSLDDLPKWEVNVQPAEPKHALHRAVCVQAPDPLTARMVALNLAQERWPDEDFTAVSAVPWLIELS